MRKLKFTARKRFVGVFPARSLSEPSSFITKAQIRQVLTHKEQTPLSVCFTGHRRIPDEDIPELTKRLDELLEMCYQHGYRKYFCGGALGFDTLAAECVLLLKARHQDAKLIFVLPCGDQTRLWPDKQTQHYERLLYAANGMRVLSKTYYEGCMHVRNRYMIDHSNLCICYLRHTKGGTASTVAYAIKQQLPVLNVAMTDVCAAFPAD